MTCFYLKVIVQGPQHPEKHGSRCIPQKPPFVGVFRIRCSENMQDLYRCTSIPKGSVISIKLQSNFREIKFWHGCSPVLLLHIFTAPPSNYTSLGLFLFPQFLDLPVFFCSLAATPSNQFHCKILMKFEIRALATLICWNLYAIKLQIVF